MDTSRRAIVTLPNLLVLVRVISIPFLIAFFLSAQWWTDWLVVILFVIAALTDLMDGRLARQLNQQTLFGTVFDPIADKLLIATVLLLLMISQHLTGLGVIPAVVILLRELLISGLREQLSLVSITLPVTRLAKWKTGSQMVACGCLLLQVAYSSFTPLGEALLWVSGLVTIVSGVPYLSQSWRLAVSEHSPKSD